MIISDAKIILPFLSGEGKDVYGRTYMVILGFSDRELEKCHSQIQWIFPLHEESSFANDYPVMTKELVNLALQDGRVRGLMIKGKKRMEDFLGIGEIPSDISQIGWCYESNHNTLRVTRIIRSLRLFGLDKASEEFYRKVRKVGEELGIGEITLGFWKRAFENGIWESLR